MGDGRWKMGDGRQAAISSIPTSRDKFSSILFKDRRHETELSVATSYITLCKIFTTLTCFFASPMPGPPWLPNPEISGRDRLSLEKGGKPWLVTAGWVKTYQ
jgi:hypothetical protein